jgi:hypothetical protein
LGQMFYTEQASSVGTLSRSIILGPTRSSFERLFCGGDVSVSYGLIIRTALDLTNCCDSAS